MKVFGYELGGKKTVQPIALKEGEGIPQNNKSRSSAAQIISERMKFRAHEDISTLETAIITANDFLQYSREELHNVYRRADEDLHLTSQWETRKMKVKEKPFRVVSEGDVEDLEATKLFEAGWFFDAMDRALDSKLWGHSLLEFGPWIDGKFREFKNNRGEIREGCDLIDRDYVKPEWGIIVRDPSFVFNATASGEYLFFNDKKFANQLIAVGRPHDLGLMLKCAKPFLFKDNCLSNWSEWAEVFAMDMRIGKTDAEGEDRRKFLATIRDLGSNGYGAIDKDDVIEYVGTTKQDAFRVYENLCRYVDSGMSKAIFGQDVISNNTGQVIGKTGENVSNMYGANDAVFTQNFVNDSLIPLMIRNGVTILNGKRWKFDSTEKLSMEQRSQIDLRISQMGKTIDDKHIKDTYGVEVTQKESPIAIAQELRKLYDYK